MTPSDAPKPSDVEIESDPQPQPQGDPKPSVPQEDDPEIEDTQEQPT